MYVSFFISLLGFIVVTVIWHEYMLFNILVGIFILFSGAFSENSYSLRI